MPAYDEDEMDSFQSYLESKGFYRIGAGSFRRVYKRGKVVVKVPKNEDGMCDNLIEAHAWKTLRNLPSAHGIVCAPCRILHNGCLMMVAVDNINVLDADGNYKVEREGWIDKLDGGQAGIYKNRWVAYDYAIDLIERHAWERALQIESDFFKNDYSRRSYNNLRDPEEPDNEDEYNEDEYNEDGECNCIFCRREREQAAQDSEPIEDERLL